jgi:hypothetical protein
MKARSRRSRKMNEWNWERQRNKTWAKREGEHTCNAQHKWKIPKELFINHVTGGKKHTQKCDKECLHTKRCFTWFINFARPSFYEFFSPQVHLPRLFSERGSTWWSSSNTSLAKLMLQSNVFAELSIPRAVSPAAAPCVRIPAPLDLLLIQFSQVENCSTYESIDCAREREKLAYGKIGNRDLAMHRCLHQHFLSFWNVYR